MKTYKIHLIRHGATQGNLEGRYIGVTDLGLCEEGRAELETLRDQFEYPYAQKVYASPLRRCVETAGILYPDHHVQTVDGLREYDFGDFEGLTMRELQEDLAFVEWMKSNMAVAPPHGEEKADFDERMRAGFEEVLKDMMHEGITAAAVVTHGGVIMGLLSMLGLPKRNPLEWIVGNGKGYTVATSSYLWSNANLVEVYDPLPYGADDYREARGYAVFDLPEDEDTTDDGEDGTAQWQ